MLVRTSDTPVGRRVRGVGTNDSRRPRFLAVCLVVMIMAVTPAAAGCLQANAAEQKGFIKPVDGPIIRHFEEPSGPYGPGHRGLDFGVPAGTAVVASNDGTISFAGPVADDGLFVTIDHADGLQTTYSFLSWIVVTAGQPVLRGERIASSGTGHGGGHLLHFGAKRDGEYIDPEPLLSDSDDVSRYLSLAPMDQRDWENGGAYRDDSDYIPPREMGPRSAGSARGMDTVDSPNGSKWHAVRQPSASRFSSVREPTGSRFSRSQGKRGSSRQAHMPNEDRRGRVGPPNAADGDTSAGEKVRNSRGRSPGAKKDGQLSWLQRADRSVARTLQGYMWGGVETIGAVAPVAGSVFKKIHLFSSGVFKKASNGARQLFTHGRFVVGNAFDSAGKWIQDLPRQIVPGKFILPKKLILGMTGGGIRQIGCFIKGGSELPTLPTSEELDNGAEPPPPPNDNIVIAVAGLGSSSHEGPDGKVTSSTSMYKMDWRTLGYKPGQVYHFSYRGMENHDGQGPYVVHEDYPRHATYQSMVDSARLLDEQIDAIQARHPGKEFDIIAHSQGGVVAAYYITRFYRQLEPEAPRIDNLVTIASPLMGTDAAQAYGRLSDTQHGKRALKRMEARIRKLDPHLPPPDTLAVQELAEGSVFMKDFISTWDPKKVTTTSIAATNDFLVPPQHTRLWGINQFTTDIPFGMDAVLGAHGAAVAAPMTKALMYTSLSGSPYRCTRWRDAFADYGPGRWLSGGQDGALAAGDALAHVQQWRERWLP